MGEKRAVPGNGRSGIRVRCVPRPIRRYNIWRCRKKNRLADIAARGGNVFVESLETVQVCPLGQITEPRLRARRRPVQKEYVRESGTWRESPVPHLRQALFIFQGSRVSSHKWNVNVTTCLIK
jgi:hypothetical protein